MHFVNTDALYHQNKSPEKCLLMAEKEKYCKYLEACHRQRYHFYQFILYVDVLLGMEAEATLIHIAIHLATKWENTYSRMCGYVKSRA